MITKVIGKQEVLGTGKPDFSKKVSSAKQRSGLRLQANQQLKMYGRSLNLGGDAEYPGVLSTPLAAGADTHLTDFETLAPMPMIVPQGYTLTLVTFAYTLSQDAQIYAYTDLGLVVTCFAAVEGGLVFYENAVVGLTTKWIDATGAHSHIFDLKLYNTGGANLFGGVVFNGILEAVGTKPLPTTKECHCPYCGNKQIESVHATRIKCTSCGREYGVYDLTNIKET